MVSTDCEYNNCMQWLIWRPLKNQIKILIGVEVYALAA